MTPFRLFAILAITGAATVAWFVLGVALHERSAHSVKRLGEEVRQVWGPGLRQPHLSLVADNPSLAGGSETLLPASSKVHVDISYTPKKRGLLWHRTYDVVFSARYEITNTASSARNVRIRLGLPATSTSYDNFIFQLGESGGTEIAPKDGVVETVTLMPAGATLPLTVHYNARGLNAWTYAFEPGSRVRDFTLTMQTSFDDVSFPVGATSPSQMQPPAGGSGMELTWNYKDTIDARDIAMDMPKLLNAGPVMARITFFAPVSLVLFFGVLVVTGMLRGTHLHPMVYAFLAAGFFSFHLLLAYLGDQMPLHAAFFIAAMISLALVSGYLHLSVGRSISGVAAIAQTAYMVLFSYSFFFDGITGLTLALTAVSTLALLMLATAKLDWEEVFRKGREVLAGRKKQAPPSARPAAVAGA